MAGLEKRAAAERRRLSRILKNLDTSETKQKTLAPIIENVAWMKAKLDDARELARDSSVAIPYDNGGGQTGIRENPLFKGYESLWKSYMAGMEKILACLPEEQVQQVEIPEKPSNVLSFIREKHRKQA